MNEFRTRIESPGSFMYSWFSLAILCIILILSVRGTYTSFAKKHTSSLEEKKFEKKLSELKDKKKKLELKINSLKTDRGLEEELRGRYNVIREGETLIRVIE